MMASNPVYPCAICKKPVELGEANTDSEGGAVHEHCYVQKVTSQKSPATPDSK
jgi:hypothetical protein